MKKQVFHEASHSIQETRVAKGYIIEHFLSEDESVIFRFLAILLNSFKFMTEMNLLSSCPRSIVASMLS